MQSIPLNQVLDPDTPNILSLSLTLLCLSHQCFVELNVFGEGVFPAKTFTACYATLVTATATHCLSAFASELKHHH